LRAGRITIIVAHRFSMVRDAGLVVVMVDGRAVEQGSHAQLLEKDGLCAPLVRTQAFAL
jgi:ATP-binding cassette, subfamily B, bacterial MsbA